MYCERCKKPMKERLVSDEFVGSQTQVTVTGIRAGVCSYCGYQAVDPETLDEIEMFIGPLLGGGMGMRLLGSSHLTIDLGHSLHPSAIDIAGPTFQQQFSFANPLSRPHLAGAKAVADLSEEAA